MTPAWIVTKHYCQETRSPDVIGVFLLEELAHDAAEKWRHCVGGEKHSDSMDEPLFFLLVEEVPLRNEPLGVVTMYRGTWHGWTKGHPGFSHMATSPCFTDGHFHIETITCIAEELPKELLNALCDGIAVKQPSADPRRAIWYAREKDVVLQACAEHLEKLASDNTPSANAH